ncbi:pyridoxamine 5'-phosphate oxidase family protein [Vibrio sp. JC009]|uniref:pyridoxamine 5'-phosphate oxidase family protein n=1 Tax=Vibrio sp. JC009 TaxID=2912314 RepID=UPI0023AF82C2|nr:pyridoxamine 5'-phosphate oxidase family protein [Vibrio sp. JC009]WED23755.1 pyridoxamine 5'-phosphate oxidase family protein [Vibrio sp. JC009]
MQNVIDFLFENELQYFATIGLDGKPKVRPFQMMFNDGGKLIYCTGANKEVYQELQENPSIELCISTLEHWLRIRGEVCWMDDMETKEKIIETSELVASIYKSADNPNLKVFYLKDATAVFTDFSKKAPEIIKLC